MNYQTIEYKRHDQIGIIKLNRPERMNAVIEAMYEEIQDILKQTAEDGLVRVLIITGSILRKGDKIKQAFCAGADLKEHATGQRTHAQKRQYIQLAHKTTQMIYEFPKPVIAVMNGPARGAGAEMALNCDFIIMADSATIAFPEIGLGTFVGGGVTRHLQVLVGSMKARELIYTGKVLDGQAAVAYGVALKSFPIADLDTNSLTFAKELAKKAPLSLKFAKERLRTASSLDLDTVLALETEMILACMDSDDWQEGINAFRDHRNPVFTGK